MRVVRVRASDSAVEPDRHALGIDLEVECEQSAELVASDDAPSWFPVVWKLTCVEVWARVFLESDPAERVPRAA